MRAMRVFAVLLLPTTLYLAAVAYAQTNPSREQILQAGRDALGKRHYAEAVQLLEDGLKRFPNDQTLKSELGRAYLYNRQDDRAIRLFREVLREEPSNRVAKLELARALGYHRKYEASNRLYRELLKANPDDEPASLGLIRNLMHQKRKAEARRELERALARHPNSERLQEYKKRLGMDKAGVKGGDLQRGSEDPERAEWRKNGRLQGSGAYYSDSAGNRSWRFWEIFDYDIGHGLSTRLQVEERSLWKTGGSKANVVRGIDELRFRPTRFLLLAGGGGAVRFADGSNRVLYRAELELHPAKGLWFAGGFSRFPIYPTFQATQFNLLAEGWHARLDWDPGPWRLNASWSRQHYSDSNRVQRVGAELLRWTGSPRLAFGAGYRFNHFTFTQSFRHGYFNPSRYQSHLGVAGIRFRLGENFRGEYLARVGGESIAAGPYQGAWEVVLRNRMLFGNWELGGDYFYFHLAQVTGAFRAHFPRFVIAYRF